MADFSTNALNIVPDHVPPELVWNNSLEDYALEFQDPFKAIARLNEGPPIIWSPRGYRGQPAWILTRYALIEEAYMDHERFASGLASDITGLLDVDWHLIPLEIDPPLQLKYRKIIHDAFTPRAINAMDRTIRGVCDELIAQFEGRGACEFISEFASLFPAKIFMALMGLPQEMVGQFLKWSDDWMRAGSMEQRIQSARDILAFLEGVAADRVAAPREDLASVIATATIDGQRLGHDEILGFYYLLYLGGLDTVMNSLGWYFHHLAQDTVLQNRLRTKPAEIPQAVDEFLRAFGITTTRRTATRDFNFHGVAIRAGDWVVTSTPLASRDPNRFARPNTIDIDRGGRHMTFGSGVHSCIGVHLARREIRIVFETFLSRFDAIRLDSGEDVPVHTTGVWGIDRLMLSLDRRAAVT